MRIKKNIFFIITCLFIINLYFITASYSQSYVLGNIGDKTISEGDFLEFNIDVPSNFGSDLTWTVEGLPEGRFYEVPAFPGAEGFGAKSIGGRGGRVIKVTNLESSGEGSLQWAVEQKGPRIVVFDVSGVIEDPVTIKDSRITIAGQTAPGAGITINNILQSAYSDSGLEPGNYYRKMYHDVILRFLRVRPVYYSFDNNADCGQFTDIDRLVLDHISASWGMDECFDLSSSRDISFQWNTIEETGIDSGSTHNYGMIVGYSGRDASLHHNLFAHHRRRTPLCGLETMDHRNNVIYNVDSGMLWHTTTMNHQRPGQLFKANIINNYYKHGPNATKDPDQDSWMPSIFEGISIVGKQDVKPFIDGNYYSWINDYNGGYLDLWNDWLPRGVVSSDPKYLSEDIEKSLIPYSVPDITTYSAEKAYDLVLVHAGCLPKDYTSERIENEVRTGSGEWGREFPPNNDLMYGLSTTNPSIDSDDDGIPDSWEIIHGLNPYDGTDYNNTVLIGKSYLEGYKTQTMDRYKGYTYIEYYINELADKMILEELLEDGYDVTYLPGYGKINKPTVSWVPTYDEEGKYTVTITASDGQNTLSETITINVLDTNRYPFIEPHRYMYDGKGVESGKSIFAEQLFTFEMYVKDPDGDNYIFEGEVPDGFTVIPTGEYADLKLSGYDVYNVSWTPTMNQIGTHTLNFTASDGILVDETSFVLKVVNPLTCNELDGEICTVGQTCSAKTFIPAIDTSRCCSGKCICVVDSDCDDDNVCTTDTCNAEGSCEHASNSNSCEDGFFCTINDYCSGGTCISGTKNNAKCLAGYNDCSNAICNPLLYNNLMGCGNYQPVSCEDKGGYILDMKFEGNMQDSSGRENHGTCTGVQCPQLVADRHGNPNSAYYFDGDDQIIISDNAVFDIEDSTIAAWVYFDYNPRQQYIISKNRIDADNSLSMAIGISGTLFTCGTDYPSTGDFSDYVFKSVAGKWMHIAVSRKKINATSSEIEFFSNGVSRGKVISGNNEPNDRNLYIGSRTTNSFFLDGIIDDISIFSRALNQDELNNILDIKSQFETSSCISLNGVYCSVDELCSGSWVLANDTNMCCSGTCYAADATFHPADLNKNNNIEFGEVFSYTQKWLKGSVTLKQVLDIINMWRNN